VGRIPRPSPAMVVAIISLVIAIGGTAAALPGKFIVGRDDLKNDSIGARVLGRTILGHDSPLISTDPVAGDGAFTEVEGLIDCPSRAQFGFDPSVSGLGPRAYVTRVAALSAKSGAPGSYRIVLISDEGPGAIHAMSINCLPNR